MLQKREFKERKAEIELLCRTAGYVVEGVFAQKSSPRARFLVGSGKVKEIQKHVKDNGIDLIVFENYLSSRQLMSLENAIGLPVIDKFDLILNVFEKHASNREALLQIELARLKRKLPYIKMSLGRRVREDHPGFGGSGEYIIHSTLAELQKRIKRIEEKLGKFEGRVELQSKRRKKKGKVISLVGYTNVGKTTLLNTLTKAGKEAKNEFFTTLSPKAAGFRLYGEKVFMNDTVGFIRNLPHELIYAFRATLRQIAASDLILMVMDVSESLKEFIRKKEMVEETLVRIGTKSIPTIYVLNKADLLEKVEAGKLIDGSVLVSAQTELGIEGLKKEIAEVLRLKPWLRR
jgi:GTP-binding protein HflX